MGHDALLNEDDAVEGVRMLFEERLREVVESRRLELARSVTQVSRRFSRERTWQVCLRGSSRT